MLRHTMIAAATALTIGVGGMAASVGPAAADSYGFYLQGPGFGVYGGNNPRHLHRGPPPPRYSRYSQRDCWAWSPRLHQRVWTCGAPHRDRGPWGYN